MARGQGRKAKGPRKPRRVGLPEREQRKLKRRLLTKKAAAKESEAKLPRTESGAVAENRKIVEEYAFRHNTTIDEAKRRLGLRRRKQKKK